MSISFSIKLKILVLIRSSCRSPESCWIRNPRKLSIFWVRSPISSKHMSFWFPFFDPHLTTHHSNIGVQIIAMLELGTSTLVNCLRSTIENGTKAHLGSFFGGFYGRGCSLNMHSTPIGPSPPSSSALLFPSDRSSTRFREGGPITHFRSGWWICHGTSGCCNPNICQTRAALWTFRCCS